MSVLDRQSLIDFIYHEIRLLDEARFDEWLDLWMEDGIYWMPLQPNQIEENLVTSLLYEDLFMLKLRVERLNGERTYSQKPHSRAHHVIQQPSIEEGDEATGIYRLRTPMHYVETRLDDQFLLAANAFYTLVNTRNGLKIQRKQVNLLNPDAAFGNIQLIL